MTTQSNDHSISANVALVTALMHTVWTEANPAALDQFVSADFIDHAYSPANVVGHATMLHNFNVAFSQARHHIEQCTAQNDMVVLRVRVTAIHSGMFRGITATGKPINVTQYRSFRIGDGKIVEHWALFDTAGLLRQIDAALPATEACAIK